MGDLLLRVLFPRTIQLGQALHHPVKRYWHKTFSRSDQLFGLMPVVWPFLRSDRFAAFARGHGAYSFFACALQLFTEYPLYYVGGNVQSVGPRKDLLEPTCFIEIARI
jgi:hypothetical protein